MTALTRAEFLVKLRVRLDDSDPDAPRWSDAELNEYLVESTARYSKLQPRRRPVAFTTDGSTSYVAPDDLIDRQVHELQYRSGSTLVDVPEKRFRLRRSTRYYEVLDDTLRLGWTPAVGTVFQMVYSAVHTMPDDDATASSVPTEDYDMIYLWAECLAWRRLGGNDAALSRWREGQKRDDGPMIPHHVMLERQYEKLAKEKKASGRVLTLVRTNPTVRSGDRY